MDEMTRRIVVWGKTGAGKSSLGNTLFGKSVFSVTHHAVSGTKECQAKSISVNGKNLIFIDTPGSFDTSRTEEEMKPEVLKCITECAPGPHVFLIVLKVEKLREHEKAVVEKITSYFSEEALKYTIVLFTHGDQLPEGLKIQDFVNHSEDLQDLVMKCGGRCHVVDNKYWNNDQQEEYRTNKFQLKELINTIDKLIETNKGGYYSTEMLHAVQREIEKEEEHVRQSSENLSAEEITQKAKITTFRKLMNKAASTKTHDMLRADQQEEYWPMFQLKKLFGSVSKLWTNKGGYYPTEELRAIKRETEKEEDCVRQSSENLSAEEITQKTEIATFGKLMNKAEGIKSNACLRELLHGVMKEEPSKALNDNSSSGSKSPADRRQSSGLKHN